MFGIRGALAESGTERGAYCLGMTGLDFSSCAVALSDIAIGISYLSIPIALAYFVRRRRQDLPLQPVFLLFAAFILLSGISHFVDLAGIWRQIPELEASIKVMTAIASAITALAVWKLMPSALALPSPNVVRQANEELARMAESLRVSEAAHRWGFERSPMALHMSDRSGRILAVSDAWLSLLGHDRSEVVGRPIADFLAPDSDRLSRDEWLEVVAGMREVVSLPRRMVRADGSIVEAEVSMRAGGPGLPGATEGVGERVMGAVLDVTARNRAERALRESEDRLRDVQRMEAISQITGGVAHEFNNALQGISMSLEMIRKRLPDGDRAAIMAEKSLESSRRVARMTRQLMGFSRRQSLDPKPLDPETVLQGMRELLEGPLGEGVVLHVDVRPGTPVLLADRTHLEAALLNLALNARDALKGTGEITITADSRHVEAASTTDGGAQPGCYVRISVRDDGPGMEPDVAMRAFQPFFTTKPEGTGLGLPQVHGFAHQSGGSVTLDSVPGLGTEISVLLPCAHQEGVG